MPTVTIPHAHELALQHHRAGRLAEAEAIYRQILACEPNHADALHLLGAIAHQVGRNDVAVDLMRRAIAANPSVADYHNNLSVALKEAGQLDAAIAASRNAIRLRPDSAEAHNNLGNALREKGRIDESIAACRQALQLKPDYAEAHNNLANALNDRGQLDEAISEYRRAIQLKPDFALACYNLGNALRSKGEFDGAVAAFRAALQLKPDYADACNDLGNALMDQGRLEEAIAAYRRAIQLKPDSPEWQYVLDGLTRNSSATAAPASYVRKLFDEYAHQFDKQLVGQLNYRVPEQLLDAILSVAPERLFDILDLGCGTGLCGAQFCSHAEKLVGVDLAPKMIEKAAARGIYDQLITADAVGTMREHGSSFDLILAGDMFVYVGDLAEIFSATAHALRDGGFFAFSLERHAGEGFVLHSRVRFAHSLTYIRELSRQHHFVELFVREISVRKEGADEVPGWIVVLRKSSAARGAQEHPASRRARKS